MHTKQSMGLSNGIKLSTVTLFSSSGNPLTNGVTCPAITPTLGSELLANPGFEGTYDTEAVGIDIAPDWSNAGMDAGTDTASKETTTVHGGSASQNILVDAAVEGIVTDADVTSAGNWYQYYVWGYRYSGGGYLNILDSGGDIYAPDINVNSVWTQGLGTGRALGGRTITIRTRLVGAGWYIDDASVKQITLSSMLSSKLGTWTGRDGTYICKPTVASATQTGMAIAYLNATNFVVAFVSNASSGAGATAKLLKYISGTWTQVISGSITYSAGAELKVVISGTSYDLYYNGVQVGTTQTISDTLGEDVYGFNSYSGNTVGVVSVNPT